MSSFIQLALKSGRPARPSIQVPHLLSSYLYPVEFIEFLSIPFGRSEGFINRTMALSSSTRFLCRASLASPLAPQFSTTVPISGRKRLLCHRSYYISFWSSATAAEKPTGKILEQLRLAEGSSPSCFLCCPSHPFRLDQGVTIDLLLIIIFPFRYNEREQDRGGQSIPFFVRLEFFVLVARSTLSCRTFAATPLERNSSDFLIYVLC